MSINRRYGVRGRIVGSVAGAAVVIATWGVGLGPVLGHCPNQGVDPPNYASGHMHVGAGVDGAKVLIPWTNPNVCAENVSHSVSITSYPSWVQSGWWKQSGQVVKGYCEFQGPGPRQFIEFNITQADHQYQVKMLPGLQINKWECIYDGVVKYSANTDTLGFIWGPDIAVQGEAQGVHVQIGKMAPGALLISAMQYRNRTTQTWAAINVTLDPTVFPYGRAEPAVGQLQVWTNAH